MRSVPHWNEIPGKPLLFPADLSGVVPYTGAAQNVNLGSNELTAGKLNFNIASGSGFFGASVANQIGGKLDGYFPSLNSGGALSICNRNYAITPLLTLGSSAYPVAVWDTTSALKAYIQPDGLIGGTYIAANTPSGFIGNNLLIQHNGANKLLIPSTGANVEWTANGIRALTSGGGAGGISLNGTAPASNVMYVSGGFTLQPTTTISSGSLFTVTTPASTITSLTLAGAKFNSQFSPTSGTAVFNSMELAHTINQTGGASGITRGFYSNATLTSAAAYRAFESNNNVGHQFYGAGTAPSYFGGQLQAGAPALTAIAGAIHGVATTVGGQASVFDGMAGQTGDISRWRNSVGTTLAKVDVNGYVHSPILIPGGGGGNPMIFAFANGAYSVSTTTGQGMTLWATPNLNGMGIALAGNGIITSSSGSYIHVNHALSFSPTAGGSTFAAYRMVPTINQTGGANGTTRGLWISPSLTAAADWRSIETSNNIGFAFYGAGTAPSHFGGNVNCNQNLNVEGIFEAVDNATFYSNVGVEGNVGFYGVGPIAQQSLPTNPTTAQIATVLSNLGLVNLI